MPKYTVIEKIEVLGDMRAVGEEIEVDEETAAPFVADGKLSQVVEESEADRIAREEASAAELEARNKSQAEAAAKMEAEEKAKAEAAAAKAKADEEAAKEETKVDKTVAKTVGRPKQGWIGGHTV